jgi:hypothetical protein
LSYQWHWNGTNVPGATTNRLAFASVDATNAGVYGVLVSNQFGSVQSLPALLAVTNLPGGGWVRFAMSMSNWVYEPNGTTRLAGTNNYVAQLYAGATPTVLRPLGPTRKFMSNPNLVSGPFTNIGVQIPDVPDQGAAYVQARVWQTSWGASYEEARARGGKFGFSDICAITPGSSSNGAPATAILSFNLRTQLPGFSTGRIEVNAVSPEGMVEWRLVGEAGFRFLVERRNQSNTWLPMVIVTNSTGVCFFTDPDQFNADAQMYRSRILD